MIIGIFLIIFGIVLLMAVGMYTDVSNNKNKSFSGEEKFIHEAIVAARKIQILLWGESNGSWGMEEWRRMFIKRFNKIDMIDPENPHAIIELKKRLLQNAALSVALMAILHFGRPMDIANDNIPSNLPEYLKYSEPGDGV